MKGDIYGSHRVISPKGLLPQAAKKINNDVNIFSNEILIDVIALQPTATAFNAIKKQCSDTCEFYAKIMKLVEEQGKFQDPVSKSGGILIGRIKEIGEDLKGKVNIQVGDKIATLVSLSLTPLKIKKITSIDMSTEQIFCDAQAVLFESGIFAKLPEDLDEKISLAIMDVAGAPAQVAVNAKAGDIVVVVGAGKAGILCLAEAKKRVSPTGKVICLEYSPYICKKIQELDLADVVIQVDCQKPLDALEQYNELMNGILADFTVNTVNVADTELSSILVTKDTGMIYFFSMSTDFVKASLGAEGVKKSVKMLIGNGYYPGHDEIAFNIIRSNPKVKEYFIEKYC